VSRGPSSNFSSKTQRGSVVDRLLLLLPATGERHRVPEDIYPDLTLQMRLGENPAGVFDGLARRGQIATRPSRMRGQAPLWMAIESPNQATKSVFEK
jgi:hypothetical protein